MQHYCTKVMLAATLIFTASSFAQTDDYYAEQPSDTQSYSDGQSNDYSSDAAQNYAAPAPQQTYIIQQPQQQYNQGNAVPQQRTYIVQQPQQQYNQGNAVPQQTTYIVQQPQQQYYSRPYVQPQPAKPKKSGRSLQSLNFVFPIENETWKIDDGELEWNSFGFGFNWTRYWVGDNGYSSLFGLSTGYITGETQSKIGRRGPDLDGMNFNMKFGWGMAPVSDPLIFAFHFLMGIDIKALEGEYPNYHDVDYSVANIDLVLGGDLILAFQVSNNIALIGGVDITTNFLGIGVLTYDIRYTDDEDNENEAIRYMFSGLNIVPHIGIAFVF